METQLLGQGVMLMLVGMGTVFAFLTLLVGATTLMSRMALRLEPPAPATDDDAQEIAAITAAIALHRRRRHDEPRPGGGTRP